jgi:uncharacterized protein (TIGR03067 family)
MTRIAVLCGLALSAFPLTAQEKEKKEVPKELMPFQGVWKGVKLEIGGKAFPGGKPEDLRFIFAGNKLSFQEGKGIPHDGTFSADSKKEPAEIDLISSPSERISGIYKFDKQDRLTVCHAAKPGGPRPKKFDDPDTLLIVLEKTKEAIPEAKELPREYAQFQGDWKVVKIEVGGKEPKDALKEPHSFRFTGDKLMFTAGKQEPQLGFYTIDSKKDPAELDLTPAVGPKVLGIYKFDKAGRLTIATGKPGGTRPKKFDEMDVIAFTLEKVKE